MLPLIAILTFASVTFLALALTQQSGARQAAVRTRIGVRHSGGGDVRPRSALREVRSRVPFVDRLPLSAEARERMRAELESAGQPLKVNEYLGLRIASAAAFALAGVLLLNRFDLPSWAIIVAPLALVVPGWALPRAYLSRKRQRRLQQFEDQLPDALTAIAKSLKAGTGLLQALGYAGDATPDPLGRELRSTLRDLQLGADPDLVFTELSERVGSSDMDIAVTAIIIQRSIGGNLSEILTNVTNTIRERAKLKGEIRVLTARQRLTGNLVSLLPVAVGAAFVLLNPKMGDLLLHETAGQIGLAIGLAFELVGIWLIRRLAVIEV